MVFNIERKLLKSTRKFMDSDDGSELFDKRENATEEDFQRALKKAKKINPSYYDNQDEIEKEKDKEWNEEWRKKDWGERLKEKLKINDNKHEDILYKKNKDITEQEIKDTSKYTWFESEDKNLNQKLNDKVSSWNDEMYGNESQLDATGRQVQPVAKTSIASELVEAKTKDGLSSGEGFEKISEAMLSKNADVSALQTGLNNSYEYSPALKIDGDLGPKTTSRTKEAMFDFGVLDVVKKIFS